MKHHVLVFYEIDEENYKSFIENIKDNNTVKDYSDESADKNGWSLLWSSYVHDL